MKKNKYLISVDFCAVKTGAVHKDTPLNVLKCDVVIDDNKIITNSEVNIGEFAIFADLFLNFLKTVK